MNERRESVKYLPVPSIENNEDGELHLKDNLAFVKNPYKECETKSGKNSSRKFLYIAACTGNLAAFVCGTAFGWTSPVTPKLNGKIDPDNNPLSAAITSSEESWIGSLLPVGAAIGPFVAGILSDRIGRKKTLLLSITPFILGFLLATFASSVMLLYVIRFMWGLAVGGVFTVLPMYIGEISEDEVRGSLGSFMQLFITFGLLFSYAIGPFVSIKAFNIACIITPIIFVPVFTLYIPESPYYLLAQRKQTEATESLKKLRSKPAYEVEYELTAIKNNIEAAMATKGNFMDIFKSKGLTKAFVISLALVGFQQFSGINVVLFYTQTIFAATGSSIPAEICTIITGVVQVLSSFITPAIVDQMGKRFLLLFSALGMCVSEAILGYFFYLQDKKENVEALFWLPIVCLVGYNVTYCMGFGPLPWAVMGELFPANVKSVASTATASVCWVLAFIITKFFSNVTDIIGIAGSFWIFTGCCVVAAAFVYWYVPETSGKSLEEIQRLLSGAKS